MAGILEGLSIGFVGAGAMAEAMLRGLNGSGARLLASDPDPVRRQKIKGELGVEVMAGNPELVAEVQVVVL
ncbi:MAG: NAD(P)-binding domain-containing protein, partial [Firmicutes bacterium]|nr:NAD(P)-binding domain-containing protein [Bacillota bacterium]